MFIFMFYKQFEQQKVALESLTFQEEMEKNVVPVLDTHIVHRNSIFPSHTHNGISLLECCFMDLNKLLWRANNRSVLFLNT